MIDLYRILPITLTKIHSSPINNWIDKVRCLPEFGVLVILGPNLGLEDPRSLFKQKESHFENESVRSQNETSFV